MMILVVAVLLLYAKWIFLVSLYPLEVFWGLYKNQPSSMLRKVLAAPAFAIECFLRFGGVDF